MTEKAKYDIGRKLFDFEAYGKNDENTKDNEENRNVTKQFDIKY